MSSADAPLYQPPVEAHLIDSKYVAQTFKVQVMQPEQKRGEHTRFPVVLATDANRAFDMLKGISQLIQATGHDAPRFILVGIGYPGDAPRAGAMLRAREFTSPAFPKRMPAPPLVEGVLVAPPGTKDVGGAEDFQQFIEHELIPFVDRTYATAAGDRTYYGHSGGGSFGLFTLFTRPHLFKRYVISSPGLSYHGELAGVRYDHCDFLFEDARRFLARPPSLNGVRAYLSAGTEEEFEPGLEAWRLTSSFYRMAALLKTAAIPGLDLITEVFPKQTHMALWPMSFIHGVRAVFSGVGGEAVRGVR